MISNSISKKIIFKALEKTKFGKVSLQIQNQNEETFGEGPLVAKLVLKNEDVIAKIARGGDIALADAILENDLTISDEAAFVEWACRNDEALRAAFHGTWLGTIAARLRKMFRGNTVAGAQKNIMAHYDLGNDFYKSWLDSSMTYSSALFSSNEFQEELLHAQYNKYDRIIDELDIKSGDHVLEVGCGWGGFFSRAVEKTGCKVTAVMNSPAQAAYNRNLIESRKFQKNVDLRQIDYRQITGRYDKIVSIEMIEAVGYPYWSTYFEKVSASLKDKGRALIQAITIQESRFEDYLRNPDFINTYIFPGGMLLTNEAVAAHAKKLHMTSETPFEFGSSYSETLRRWRKAFQNSFNSDLSAKFDDRFFKLWNFYLSYCEGAFNANRINVAHFSLKKQ